MTMGHVLLNVNDVEAHKKFWMTQFDARPLKVGRLEGIKIPGLVVLFRQQPRTGPGEGETINHLGLKLLKLSDYTSRFEKAGWKFDPPRVGRESRPDVRDRAGHIPHGTGGRSPLPAAVVSHHLHYWIENPAAVKKWYVDKLLLKPTMRGPYESGDLPGMNLTMAPLGRQRSRRSHKGTPDGQHRIRSENLQAYLRQASGERRQVRRAVRARRRTRY